MYGYNWVCCYRCIPNNLDECFFVVVQNVDYLKCELWIVYVPCSVPGNWHFNPGPEWHRWLMMSSHCLILMYDCLSRCFRGYTWGCGLQEDLVGHHLGGPPQVNGDYSPPPPVETWESEKQVFPLLKLG